MAKEFTLPDKIDLLFRYGADRGISSAYRAIAEATGENANNIRKIHRGENRNPGLRTLLALSEYFHIDLAYFNRKTRADCERYLVDVAQKLLTDEIQQRASGMSETGLEAVRNMMDFVRKAEGLKPVDDH